MKTLLVAFLTVLLTATVGFGQIKALQAGSAEELDAQAVGATPKNTKVAANVAESAGEQSDLMRTWTITKDHEQFKGRFEGMGTATLKNGSKIQEVMIRREGASRPIGVAPERLSEEDQRWVRQELKRREDEKSAGTSKTSTDDK